MKALTPRRTAVLLVVGVTYYAFEIGARAVALLRDGRPAFRGLGVGLLALVVVGLVVVAGEVRFGLRSQRLARLRGSSPASRVSVEEADAAFDVARAAVEAAPEDWRAWYDLAVAYGDARDTRRGREAMRRAISLERAS